MTYQAISIVQSKVKQMETYDADTIYTVSIYEKIYEKVYEKI